MFNQNLKKMYKTDVARRYQLFLNEAIDLCKQGVLKNMSTLIKKYGVTSSLATFIVEKGIIKRTGTGRHVVYSLNGGGTVTFGEFEAGRLAKEFNVWKFRKRTKLQPEDRPDVKTEVVGLSTYTTQQLITELRHRGYTGNLYIKKEIKV
jgi:hypothetical protein